MKKLMFMISVITLILISSFAYDYFTDATQSSDDIRSLESNTQSRIVIPSPTTITQTSGKPSLTVAELKSLLQKTPAYLKLPKNAVIVFSFFDGNGVIRNEMYFTIYGDRRITNSLDPKYDFKITTGDYYIDKIKSSNNLCLALKSIKTNKDYRVHRRISPVNAFFKYRSILSYRSCLS